MTRPEYIQRYARAAQRATRGTKLFPSVALAQGILESGNGNSTLTSRYKNHFGIKAIGGWTGKKVYFDTKEQDAEGNWYVVNAPFRWYDTDTQSFKDRVSFLKNNSRYAANGVFKAKNAYEQADALQRAGYATAKDYATVLKQIIRENNLTRYDNTFYLPTWAKWTIGVVVVAVIVYFVYKYRNDIKKLVK